MTDTASALELTNVSLKLRGQQVLDDICLTLHDQDFLGLIGPNGGGKTTLLRVILGLTRPDSGTVRVFGKPPEAVRNHIGYVPQFARVELDFPITALEVVLMGRLSAARRFSWYSSTDRTIAHEALALVNMQEQAEVQIGKLSGGQVQRILIARALAAEPKMLIMDEPTASLDTRIGREVYELFEQLSQQMTIILVSHDIGVISKQVKTIACLNRKLHYHHSKELSEDILEAAYGCPVDLIAHGHAHRVLGRHEHPEDP